MNDRLPNRPNHNARPRAKDGPLGPAYLVPLPTQPPSETAPASQEETLLLLRAIGRGFDRYGRIYSALAVSCRAMVEGRGCSEAATQLAHEAAESLDEATYTAELLARCAPSAEGVPPAAPPTEQVRSLANVEVETLRDQIRYLELLVQIAEAIRDGSPAKQLTTAALKVQETVRQSTLNLANAMIDVCKQEKDKQPSACHADTAPPC